METLHRMGLRWKQYEQEGKWVYQQHPFWCTGYTFVSRDHLPPMVMDLGPVLAVSLSDLALFTCGFL